MFKYLIPFSIATLFSFLLTPLVRTLALKIMALDWPDERKMHERPMPTAGGLSIFFSFILSILTVLVTGFYYEYFSFLISDPKWFWALLGGLIIVGMGLFDDIRRAHFAIKALLQMAAGLLLIHAGFQIKMVSIPFISRVIDLGLLSIPFTILWIVGITNALNLIDGLDGLAAGVAFIASVTIFSISILSANMPVALLSCILAGSILGFLKYNFHPASIFLGDTGSLFLGYILSIISIEGGYKEATVLSMIIPILALGFPILDTILSMIRRFLKGLGLVEFNGKYVTIVGMFKADKDHIHHRLTKLGISHKNAVFILYGFCLILSLGTISSLFLKGRDMGFLVVAIGIATYIGIRRLGYRELEIFKRGALLPIFSLPVVNRRIFHVFFDMAFIGLAYIGAFLIRYEDASYEFIKLKIFQTFPLILAIKVTTFYFSGLYRRSWRYTNIADFICISRAIFSSSFFSFLISHFVFITPVNLTVFIIDFLLLSVLIGGGRISFRILDYFQRADQKVGEKTLIYGAGTGGTFALNEFLSNPAMHLIPIGFLDDSPDKVGKLVNGYPVLGTLKDLPAILENHHPSQIIISSAKISPEKAQMLKTICEERGIRAKKFRIELQDMNSGDTI